MSEYWKDTFTYIKEDQWKQSYRLSKNNIVPSRVFIFEDDNQVGIDDGKGNIILEDTYESDNSTIDYGKGIVELKTERPFLSLSISYYYDDIETELTCRDCKYHVTLDVRDIEYSNGFFPVSIPSRNYHKEPMCQATPGNPIDISQREGLKPCKEFEERK